MNYAEFNNIFKDCKIINEKIRVTSNIVEVLKYVKENYSYDLLKEIVAVDNREDGIELIYNLYSIENDEEVKISLQVRECAESVSKIFDSAIADEKEIYDLFGIKFDGNDELKRLYMPESWHGHPLRKDYVMQDERLTWNE